MIAYHGKQEIKDKYVARMKGHMRADDLQKSVYWKHGKGCAVGCTLHTHDHTVAEEEIGVPAQLMHLQDTIFERLRAPEHKVFPLAFLEAITPGADLLLVWPKFAAWLILDGEHGVVRFNDDERVRYVGELFLRVVNGEMVRPGQWDAAGVAAGVAAWDAGNTGDAAWDAAGAAADAARDARDAAWDAAWDAGDAGAAARAAARAAGAAARDAGAAGAAARAAATRAQRDKLLELLKEAK